MMDDNPDQTLCLGALQTLGGKATVKQIANRTDIPDDKVVIILATLVADNRVTQSVDEYWIN